jgi:tRNA A-37 threonylcarbamoyl transferase component Bud32
MPRYVDKPDVYFIKENVSHHEYLMQKYVHRLDILNVPKVVSYNKKTNRMVMAKVRGMNVSDTFGEKVDDVPNTVYNKLVDIMKTLVLHNICYPDFTGYNFIIDENDHDKIWIIDFEHSYYKNEIDDPCIAEVIDGAKIWNPDFI